MAFIGATPTPVPLTATDIPDLPATKITSGTFPALNGSNLTNLDASDLTGTLPAISGENLTGIASDFVLLSTTTVSSSVSSISFDGHFSSTYKNYVAFLSYVRPTSDGAAILMRLRQSNSDQTANNYTLANSGVYRYQGTSDADDVGGADSDRFILTYNDVTSNVEADGGIDGRIYFSQPLRTDTHKKVHGTLIHSRPDPAYRQRHDFIGCYYANTNALSGFTIYFDSGNIASGIIKLYGIK